MQKLIFIRFSPTSKILGNIYDPWEFKKKGFDVHFWDLSNIFFDKKKIKLFYSSSKDYRFLGPKHRIFYKKNEVLKYIKNLSQETIFFYFNRDPFINYPNDEWLYLNIQKQGSKIYTQEFENLPPNKNILKYFKFNLGLFRTRFLSRKFKINGFIGCGKIGKNYSKIIYPYAKFISVPCPFLDWSKSNRLIKKKYNIFIDENIYFFSDIIYNSGFYNKDPNGYYQRINRMLDKIEKWTGIPTVIAASGKYYYNQNPYKGRKLIYKKTLNLVKHSSLVLGHASLALLQGIVNKKPIIHIDDESFTKEYKSTVQTCSYMTNRKIIFASKMNKKFFLEQKIIDNDDYKRVIDDYFKEKNIKENYHNIVKSYLNKNLD